MSPATKSSARRSIECFCYMFMELLNPANGVPQDQAYEVVEGQKLRGLERSQQAHLSPTQGRCIGEKKNGKAGGHVRKAETAKEMKLARILRGISRQRRWT